MSNWPNPLIAGFNPDPSVVRVDGAYYLVTSTFEYLPGLPVYRSIDLVDWEHIGHVAERPEQIAVGFAPTGTGVFAPTIRYHDGLFHVIVTVVGSPRGCVVFTATDPTGPWSDGVTISGVGGIDPDLAWDDDGTAYVTYSGIQLTGEEGSHHGIEQVRVDLTTGRALERPRSLWSGTGLRYPEAPHLYRRGDHWYLLIAEGGTERGHAVSIARSTSPAGPFTGHPANPVLTASGSWLPVQNTGHADLVETPEGGWALVLLGVRSVGEARAFSPLGRETFITDVTWTEDGWPVPAPVELAPRAGTETTAFSFEDDACLDDLGWIAVRTLPRSVAETAGCHLVLQGRQGGLDIACPAFVGRRQHHLNAVVSTTVDVTEGVGGLAARYDERHHFGLEARTEGDRTVVTAWGSVAGLRQGWHKEFPSGPINLELELLLPTEACTTVRADRIRLLAGGTQLAELDGRYWTAETCASFTGRVVGLWAREGTVRFADFQYTGWETGTASSATNT
ncbi:glycoside hydrolase family 43 protein [Streptomyces flaveolus]|uniref:glycoside hydrolase family 43 protein n=1 Tax=Streptomyces flaveolus TaxID=67297 RepID=UPI0033EC0A0D